MMDRRNFILGLGSLPLTTGPVLSETGYVALKDLAARKGLLYGAAINLHTVTNDQSLANLITRECNVIVPEWEMKWMATQPGTGLEDFSAADKIAQFAMCNNLLLRGHTLAWGASIPEWAKNILRAGKNKNVLRDHITKEVTHFSKSVFEWDVANEAIEPMHRLPNGYRNSPLYRAFGLDWVTEALIAAHTAAPDAVYTTTITA